LTTPAHRLRRFVLTAALIGSAMAVTAAPALAMNPARDGVAAAGADARPAGPGGGNPKLRGYDISYPQCGGAYPTNVAFAIVGVNGGRVFSVNPCLADQLRWGGDAAAEVYINTGNPGPELSSFWPVGQTSPKICSASNPDTADCAYDYGWNAARHSYETLEAAYLERGIMTNPNATAWWLDVETSNSWREDTSLNIAALQGEVDYLASREVTKLGFYSTTAQWGEITGASKVFAAFPSWGAGAPNESVAKRHCTSTAGFTGGPLAMVQYIYNGFDANVRC
jgi:hypothetical protein